METSTFTTEPETVTVTTDIGDYEKAEFTGKNESGFEAIGDRVIVMPDQPVEKKGSIILPGGESFERRAYAAESGVVISVGPGAFKWSSDRMHEYEGYAPKVGDRVYFERYAGGIMRGRDGKFYRAMDDTCIAALHTG